METIINRVTNSGLISLDLEDFFPEGERVIYDLKDNLFMEQILREKDFRAFLSTHDWGEYSGKNVAIFCSVDAIVPTWAFMLLAVHLAPYARHFVFGDLTALEDSLFQEALNKIDYEVYRNARVVVKGCSDRAVPVSAYVELTRRLKPVVKSLMFGEPCSTVPLFKAHQ